MMRIMQLLSGDLWAGAEVQGYELCKALSNMPALDLTVVLFNHGELERRLRAADVKVVVIDESRHGLIGLFFKVMALAVTIRPQLIHTHRYKENLIGGMVSVFLPGCRSLRTVHGADEIVPHGILAATKHHVRKVLDRFIGNWIQKNAIFVSEELKVKLAPLYSRCSCRYIANGIDANAVLKMAEEAELNLREDKINVAFVGRLVPVKRVDIFIGIAALSEENYLNQFYFYVLGSGPGIEDAKKQVDQLGLNNVEFSGFVNPSAPWLSKMQALCITSDHEGLPMTLLEALSLKVPVVSRAVGGIPAVLNTSNKCAGLLIEKQDPELFLKALIDLQTEPEKREQMVEEGNLIVNNHFSMSRQAEKYFDFYADILQ